MVLKLQFEIFEDADGMKELLEIRELSRLLKNVLITLLQRRPPVTFLTKRLLSVRFRHDWRRTLIKYGRGKDIFV